MTHTLARAKRAALGGAAVGALLFTTFGMAPQASAATATALRAAPAAQSAAALGSCGITYTQSARLMKRTIRYTNNCSTQTLCIRIKTWGGPWWNVETSPRITVPAGASGGWQWARGRNHWSVYYVNCR